MCSAGLCGIMRIFLKYAYVLTRGGGYCERRQSTGLARAAADIRDKTFSIYFCGWGAGPDAGAGAGTSLFKKTNPFFR